jgi:hypothetical protein
LEAKSSSAFTATTTFYNTVAVAADAANTTNNARSDEQCSGNNDDDESSVMSMTATTTTIVFTIVIVMAMANIWFQYEQYKHHVILANLRTRPCRRDDQTMDNKKQTTNDNNHNHNDDDHINKHNLTTINSGTIHSLPPKQRWFRWILCPHYLAEILLYVTWAVMMECQYYNNGHDGDNCRNTMMLLPIMEVIFKRNTIDWRTTATTTTTTRTVGLLGFTSLQSILSMGQRIRHWMLLLWVVTNLAVSARNNYDWYYQQQQRQQYNETTSFWKKEHRAALVPFLW